MWREPRGWANDTTHTEHGSLARGHGSAFRPLGVSVLGSDSVAITALTSALDGLAARQRVIADNIANVNTPNFHAQRVVFEDALAQSVRNGDGSVVPTVHRSMEPTRTDGNNVNLDTETLSNVDTVLRYQFAARAVNAPFQAMRTALGAA
jgi:flagellar basal-body rod protein FlgB